jgi:hypothetical protein
MRNREVEEDDDNVKVHEIKFDEYGIMDDGLDDSTEKQLEEHKKAKLGKQNLYELTLSIHTENLKYFKSIFLYLISIRLVEMGVSHNVEYVALDILAISLSSRTQKDE